MKAMIFAAGLGTRLRPLTDNIPKALVKVNSLTMLEITINRLIMFGFDQIIINVHHFADQITAYLIKKQNFGIDVSISDERSQLLDTGGGLLKASYFFDDGKAFLVHNVDIISGIDLQAMYNYHISSGNMATLAVKTRNTERQLLFRTDMLLCGRINGKTGVKTLMKETDLCLPYAFSGIHIIDPEIFQHVSGKGPFALIDLYLELANNNKIGAYVHEQDEWLDVGNPLALAQAGSILGGIINKNQ